MVERCRVKEKEGKEGKEGKKGKEGKESKEGKEGKEGKGKRRDECEGKDNWDKCQGENRMKGKY